MSERNKNLIRLELESSISRAIDRYQAASAVFHMGLRGEAREIFFEDILKKWLSRDFGLGSGLIVDRFGAQSPQTDVILYNNEIIPAYLLNDRHGNFPVGSAIYSIEIKSKITSQEVKDSFEKSTKLYELQNQFYPQYGPASSFPITAIFAYESDLSGDSQAEFKRFKKYSDEYGNSKFDIPKIRILCVVGKGYWYFAEQRFEGLTRIGWYWIPSKGSHEEILGLVSGIFNSIRSEKIRRYGLNFGNYLLDGLVTPCD